MECGCRRAVTLLAAVCSTLAYSVAAPAQEPSTADVREGAEVIIPAEQHAWGRFPVGSWKLVRVTLETLDERGEVTNVVFTDTKTTLIAADAASYTLRVEVTVEIAGKRFSKLPETIKHGYQGESPGQQIAVKQIGQSQVAIDGRKIPVEVREATIESGGLKRVSQIYYCSTVWPHQLKRETTIEGNAAAPRTTTVAEVVALGLPERIGGELRPATYVKTTQRHPSSTRVTLEVQTASVPGGVVSHSATETDGSGKVVERSTLELLGYGVPEPRPEELSGRRRQARKAARRM